MFLLFISLWIIFGDVTQSVVCRTPGGTTMERGFRGLETVSLNWGHERSWRHDLLRTLRRTRKKEPHAYHSAWGQCEVWRGTTRAGSSFGKNAKISLTITGFFVLLCAQLLEEVIGLIFSYATASTLWRRRSNPARPYMERLMTFSRLICPSTGPVLQGSVKAACTASRS
jgi:hypothetical protein